MTLVMSLHHRHRPSHRRSHVSDFDRLSQLLAEADQILKAGCTQSLSRATREFIGLDFYSLKYNLDGFRKPVISINVKNRVVYVKATRRGKRDFEDLRILPHFVDVKSANWFFENGVLIVLFPYKNKLKTEVALGCEKIVKRKIVVPKLKVLRSYLR
ncbi:unnamed protein product, partial [Iphiclides podalirius]